MLLAHGDYVSDHFQELDLVVPGFAGPGTYPIAPPESKASASLRNGRGKSYDTRLFGGDGRIVVDGYSFGSQWTGRDPITGVYGTWTYCKVRGSFEFTAVNEDGDVVTITDGRFGVSLEQFPRSYTWARCPIP